MTAELLLGERLMRRGDGNDVEVLKDQHGRRVTRIGDRVVRTAGWWSPAVHDLLRHLRRGGFRYSPRVLGVTGDGQEILSYIDGEAGTAGWSQVVAPEGLRQLGALLRRYHDAVRGFRPRGPTVWAYTDRPLRPDEIVCHGDFGPWNVVWRDGVAVGILDWDLAGPGRPIDDIAYALEYCAPFRDDETAMRWLGHAAPPDRRRRVEIFLDGYGVDVFPDIAEQITDHIVDHVASRQLLEISRIELLAVRGLQPQATWVSTGLIDELHRRARWTVEHRALFE